MYIHIPFCKKKCSYCAFNSITDKTYFEAYAKAVIKELQLRSQKNSRVIKTVYIGGGTPSFFDTTLLEKIIDSLYKYYKTDIKEFSIEQNPESLTKENMLRYKAFGVNRISVGVQSFDDNCLRAVERVHNSIEAQKALITACEHFDRVSADLIVGLQHSTRETELQNVAKALSLGVTHLSCYTLSVERGTALAKQVRQNNTLLIDDDELAYRYQLIGKYLKSKGFSRYEISSYSTKGQQCLHNLNYWQQGQYIGVGVSAAGFVDGVRYTNIKSVPNYVERLNENKLAVSYSHRLSLNELEKEYIMLALRRSDGINLKDFSARFNKDFIQQYEVELASMKKYLKISKTNVAILPKYTEVSNSIIVEFM